MSQSVDWATPEWLYKELDKEFHFDFDPCPLYGAQSESDGLSVEWGGLLFATHLTDERLASGLEKQKKKP